MQTHIISGMENFGPRAFDQLKLRHLRLLIALAEQRHLGRAAEALAMTQPAASRLLAELEGRFGRPLFDRGRHGVRVLPAAAQVLRFARMVCAEEQLVRRALGTERERPGPLRVGTLPTVPPVVIEAVQRCKRERPTGDIRLHQGTLDALLPLLLDGELDVAVARYDPLLAQPPLAYRRLLDEPLSVMAAKAHPLARRREVAAEQLRGCPWVAPIRTSSLYPHFAELFQGLPLPEDVIECASPLAVRQLLYDGRRLGLLGKSALSPPSGDGLVRLRVALRSSPGPIGLYTVKGRLVPAESAAFQATLAQVVAARQAK